MGVSFLCIIKRIFPQTKGDSKIKMITIIKARKGGGKMPFGIILLLVLAALIFFGLLQTVLDRMRLTDTEALAFIGAMIIGSFIDIPISSGATSITLNIGGGLIPVVLAIYILTRSKTPSEWGRAITSAIGTGVILFFLVKTFTFEEGHTIIDPQYIFALVAASLAYILGRSRRSAFIGGIVGVLLLDVAYLIEGLIRRSPIQLHIGGAGLFDAMIISGVLAVIIAEVVGEIRESAQGGSSKEEDRELTVTISDGFIGHDEKGDNSE